MLFASRAIAIVGYGSKVAHLETQYKLSGRADVELLMIIIKSCCEEIRLRFRFPGLLTLAVT
jgi:hypothetical protein